MAHVDPSQHLRSHRARQQAYDDFKTPDGVASAIDSDSYNTTGLMVANTSPFADLQEHGRIELNKNNLEEELKMREKAVRRGAVNSLEFDDREIRGYDLTRLAKIDSTAHANPDGKAAHSGFTVFRS